MDGINLLIELTKIIVSIFTVCLVSKGYKLAKIRFTLDEPLTTLKRHTELTDMLTRPWGKNEHGNENLQFAAVEAAEMVKKLRDHKFKDGEIFLALTQGYIKLNPGKEYSVKRFIDEVNEVLNTVPPNI